ncbi:MAG: putative HicB family RNase H-like nuclease [Sphingobacteriales bacterium]|jgi:predicted HicB family RNase H-like nuclease
MADELRYKGFNGTSDYSTIDGQYFGKILSIPEFITYEAETKEALYDEFVDSVNKYLSPDKYDGDLND